MYNLFIDDCLKVLDSEYLPKFDMVFTSPPYKEEDGYSDSLIRCCFRKIYNLLPDNGVIFLNFGHLNAFKDRPYVIHSIIKEVGFKLKDTIIWEKVQFSPIQGHSTLNNVWEFVFFFYKNECPKIDRLAIGVPYKDKSNVGRYSDQDLRCAGNLWKINYETIQHAEQKTHKDRFPVELPRRGIKLVPSAECILDPFSGSSTTGVAAILEGRDYIGIEKLESLRDVSIARLNGAEKEFVESV